VLTDDDVFGSGLTFAYKELSIEGDKDLLCLLMFIFACFVCLLGVELVVLFYNLFTILLLSKHSLLLLYHVYQDWNQWLWTYWSSRTACRSKLSSDPGD